MNKKKVIFSINGSISHCGVDEYTLLLENVYKDKYEFFHIVKENSDILKIIQKNNSKFLTIESSLYKQILSIIRYCKTYNPEFVFINTAKEYFLSFFINKFSNSKIIFVRHNSFKLNFFPNYFFLKYAYKIVAPSYFCADVVKKQFSFLKDKVFVIYNTVAENAKDFDEKKIQIKNESQENIIRLGFIGRITEQKGLHLLIDALEILNNNYNFFDNRKISYNLMVGGKFSDKEYENLINQKINQKKMVKNIKFCGFIKDKKEFFTNIDILIIPSLISWKETFGLVALESFTYNKPVVAFSSGALPEILSYGPSGTTCFIQNPENLAQTIFSVYNSNIVKKYLFNSQIFLNSFVNFDRFSENYLNLIDI